MAKAVLSAVSNSLGLMLPLGGRHQKAEVQKAPIREVILLPAGYMVHESSQPIALKSPRVTVYASP